MDGMEKQREWTFAKHLVLSLITVIMIELLFLLVSALVPLLPIALSSGNGSSIGVIGGADGPTAIFVSSAPSGFVQMATFGVCSLIVLLCLYAPLRKTIRNRAGR